MPELREQGREQPHQQRIRRGNPDFPAGLQVTPGDFTLSRQGGLIHNPGRFGEFFARERRLIAGTASLEERDTQASLDITQPPEDRGVAHTQSARRTGQ
ncbi:hypothetical protein GCM10007392_47910 [Saccharospirillum salsuginis]|uniref:Uncharacterized protein n=1 Tax=Saccharospirillum salsuginis TaxID=418750 RepID=A0A918NKE3_9GAMM|nr:hypothetical protein GCM10007392_47910 [Saccharospirillum salsuginis]